MQLIYQIIVGFCALQRIGELFLAKRNEKWITSQGGKVLKETNYLFMVIMHTAWILALIYFAFFTEITFASPLKFWFGIVLFIIGQTFRIIAISTLGKRWSTRVAVLPEAPVVNHGLFNYIRHPNYVGVVIELFALPMAADLWSIAIFFTVANGIILYFRINFEERMLSEYNNYRDYKAEFKA